MLRCFVILLISGASLFAQPRPHAHNDYLHSQPLADALSQGFGSVEADVFLVGSELLVAHTPEEIKPGRTLESLYLAPLKKRLAAEGGKIITNFPTLILLIDFKTEALPTYFALEPLLQKYEPMLTKFSGANREERAVTAIISGNRPIAHMQGQRTRLAAVDGRLSDLAAGVSPALMPLISDNWQKTFQWRAGAFADAEREKLRRFVEQAHRGGQMIRFWAVPDNAEAWGLMIESGVDLINTDRLSDLAEFLQARSRKTQQD